MKKFLALSISFFFLSSIAPSLAARTDCIPKNPDTGICDEPLATCSNDTVCCPNISDCTDRSASCSTDQPWERIPTCDICGNVLFCSGNNYRACTTDEPPFPHPAPGSRNDLGYINNPPSNVMFNGISYSIPGGGLYFCDSNLFGCGNPACTSPQSGSATFTGQSQTDARIYFPHVKNTSSITYLLQSMYRPISWTVEKIKESVVYSKLTEHQGIPPDTTTVINQTNNNSSIVPDRPAPSPIFDFAHPPAGVPANGACVITNARTGAGDDLMGKKIYADLEYTQKFEYDLLPLTRGCLATGTTTTNSGACCGPATKISSEKVSPPIYQCGPKYIGRPTKGKTLVYTKSPFLEYLYQNLVAGPSAIYRRFVSQDTAQNIEDIPAKASYTATATEKTRGPSNLTGTSTDIYFPHLGSINDYFLKNLQKLLLPSGFFGASVGTPPDNSPQKDCSYSKGQLLAAAKAAGSKYTVSDAALLAISEIEGGGQYAPDKFYVCSANAAGAVGPMQITNYTYLNSGPNFITPEERLPLDYFACDHQEGKLNRCNIYDAMEMSARLLRLKMAIPPGTGIGNVTACNDIYHATCKYYGGICTDSLTRAWKTRVANPPSWDMSYADIVFALGKQNYGLSCSYIPPNCAVYGCQ